MKVAVFPCGTEIGLEIGRSLRFDKNIELFGLSSVQCHGRFIYDNYYPTMPYVTDPMFFVRLGEFKREHGIDLVIPANDITLEYFALNGQPTYHPHETIMTCSSKSRTYEKLKDVVRCPEIYTPHQRPYEVFLKPDKGHSGIGCHHVTNDAQFDGVYNGQLILEYCEGDEFTVDCFTQDGQAIYTMPRVRGNIRTGISAETHHVDLDCDDYNTLINDVNAINDTLAFNGAWFCQFKRKGNEFVLMEVAARIGGSSGSSRTISVNLPLMDIHNYLGHIVALHNQNEGFEPILPISRSLSVRADMPNVKDIYIDLDDTLILKGKVQWQVMAFIYKYMHTYNMHLCTRNKDPYKVLDKYRIPLDLFKTVCIVKTDQKKADYVGNGMLIDDSFSERNGCLAVDLHSLDLYL